MDYIKLMFAREDDTYFCEDLLQLDLDAYLWRKLHREGYDTVYFLEEADNDFQVKTFGDKGADGYKGRRRLLGGKMDPFSEWMLEKLKKKTAIVCRLPDFCRVMEQKNRRGGMEALIALGDNPKRKGTLVLVASPVAEDTTGLLLSSPVFGKYDGRCLCKPITDVRGMSVTGLYERLDKDMQSSCESLSSFTWNRVDTLVRHVLMRYPERVRSEEKIKEISRFLTQYLNHPQLRRKFPFPGNVPGYAPNHQQIYQWLRDGAVWERLERYAGECEDVLEVTPTLVIRRADSFAGRCIRMELPAKELETHEEAAKLLEELRGELASPKNRMENETVKICLEAFLTELVPHPEDWDTIKRRLFAMRFCTRFLYEDELPNGAATILDNLKHIVRLSSEHFQRKQNQRFYAFGGSELQAAHERQLNSQLVVVEKQLQQIDSTIRRAIQRLETKDAFQSMTELLAEIENGVTNMNAAAEQKETPQDQTPAALPEEDPNYQYNLDECKFDI